MTKRSVLLTAVPLALLAVCAAVLLLACGTVLSQEYLSARPDSTVEAAVPFSPTKSSILRGPAIAAFLRKCRGGTASRADARFDGGTMFPRNPPLLGRRFSSSSAVIPSS